MPQKLSTKDRRPIVDYLLTSALVDCLRDADARLINSRSTMSQQEFELWVAIRDDLLDELASRQLQFAV